jgi:hypothetical protein
VSPLTLKRCVGGETETLDGAVLCVLRDDEEVACDLIERFDSDRRELTRGIARRLGRWAMTNGMRLVVLMKPYSNQFYQRMAESGILTARGKSDGTRGVDAWR